MPYQISKNIVLEYLVPCEDVREEIGNKFSLVGVINGDILSPTFPAMIKIAFFGCLTSKFGSRAELEMKLLVNDKEVGTARSVLEFVKGSKTANVVLPQGVLNLAEPSTIRLDIKGDGGDWITPINKKVMLTPSTSS